MRTYNAWKIFTVVLENVFKVRVNILEISHVWISKGL